MIIPLTLADFLERAELVYGEREAIVDEPNPPGGGLGRITYRRFAAVCRSMAAPPDDLGVGEGERVAVVSPNTAPLPGDPFGGGVFRRGLLPVHLPLHPDAIPFNLVPSRLT